MDYMDRNGKPYDIKKKASQHIKKLKEKEKENKIKADELKNN